MAPLGVEWIVDADGCTPARLRDPDAVGALFDELMHELELHAVDGPRVHRFAGEGGLTAFVILSESHLAVHTFPEFGALTLNLYCCRERPPFDWRPFLERAFGARRVSVRTVARGCD
jgi:S-adenosylmethionine decarboxylase